LQQPTVIPLAKQHYEQARKAMGRAFEDYPLLRYVMPDDRRRLSVANALYGGIIRYCLHYGESYTNPEVAGAACWLPPERPFPTFLRMIRARMHWLPFQLGWTAFSRLDAFDKVASQMHRQYGPGPHWYLWAIGVAPERQGQGVGAGLMRPILARADAGGLPCYLETHKEMNTLIYARSGFEVVCKSSVPGHPGTIWGMLRTPGATPPAGAKAT